MEEDEMRSNLSRRALLRSTAAAAAAGMALTRLARPLSAETPAPKAQRALSADEALRELLEGNARFADGKPTGPRRGPADFRSLAEGQAPEAILVSCSDSRVAPELLFDVGVGDLFVVRVAGNVVSGAGVPVKGSIEYAVAELNVPLIVVLGHSACGAVKAAMAHIDAKDSLPGSIDGLVELIKPAVASTRGAAGDPLENAIRANVLAGVERVRTMEPIVAPKVKEGKVKVVGGVYDLTNGRVKLL
jgi:carbonic anhydrase